MPERKTCDYVSHFDGVASCTHPEIFLVQVGTRKSDAQGSCARHLARTCRVMSRGDGGVGSPPKTLTVTMTGMF